MSGALEIWAYPRLRTGSGYSWLRYRSGAMHWPYQATIPILYAEFSLKIVYLFIR